MAKTKNIKESCLQALASQYPETVGKYDPKKQQLTTPTGDVLSLELAKVGRSDYVYVAGDIRDFLKTLDLPELTGAKEDGGMTVSLSDVPARQVNSSRSWGAWFKVNTGADPEAICAAVKKGYAQAEEAIQKAREAAEKAELERKTAEARQLLKDMKRYLGEELFEQVKREV